MARSCAYRPTASPTPHGYALTGHISQGESVDRTFVLASPKRGGVEWAYVAASRQRHDLQVFVTYHEAENVEEALARTWSRSRAKSLALDLVDPADREAAMDTVRAEIRTATPERLLATAAALAQRREELRERLRATADDRGRRIEAAWALERAESGLVEARGRERLVGDRLERTPAWRRRERDELRADLPRAGRDVDGHRADRRAARESLVRLGPGDDAGERAQRLGVELRRAEDRLAAWDRGVRGHGRERPWPERGLSR